MPHWLKDTWRSFRTARHFPVSAVYHRIRLKISRKLAKPSDIPGSLAGEWTRYGDSLPLTFSRRQWLHCPAAQEKAVRQSCRMLTEHEAELLNEPFPLPENPAGLIDVLPQKTPLWRENYIYLEFLHPLARAMESSPQNDDRDLPEITRLAQKQFEFFMALDFRTRTWSTYGVARRILACLEWLPLLEGFPEDFQNRFLGLLWQDAHWLARFPEADVRGNHLIKNLHAWLAVTLAFEKLPAARETAARWWQRLSEILPRTFAEQVLPDGFHYERTPMYHAWVLQDLLDCLAWLKARKPDYDRTPLEASARQMLAVLSGLRHSSGQLPLFGDSSLPQTPDLDALSQYGAEILGMSSSQAKAAESLASCSDNPSISPITPASPVIPAKAGIQEYQLAVPNGSCPDLVELDSRLRGNDDPGLMGMLSKPPLQTFPDAGFSVFRQVSPEASLVFDFGNFGPKALPAHAHCDIGSFEVHVGNTPVIVDAGISEYTPSLLRDYFRGTAAHNTLWVPGEEQAEIWGSFRVAEYPECEGPEIEADTSGAKVTVAYENHNNRYHHQRSIYSVNGRFWVVQDWVRHLAPADRPCYSLLHIHPERRITCEDLCFQVDDQLTIVPFGASRVEWSSQQPWRHNLNLYSEGFSRAGPGQLIALTPKLPDCFGWLLIPCGKDQPVRCERLGEGAELRFTDGSYRLTWDSEGLRVAFLEPAAG